MTGSNPGGERAHPITLGQVCKPGPRTRGGNDVAMALLGSAAHSFAEWQAGPGAAAEAPRENNAWKLHDSPAERGAGIGSLFLNPPLPLLVGFGGLGATSHLPLVVVRTAWIIILLPLTPPEEERIPILGKVYLPSAEVQKPILVRQWAPGSTQSIRLTGKELLVHSA